MLHEGFCVVYSGNIVQADLLKCVLEGEGIETFLEDEFVGMIAPYVSSSGGAGAVKVVVPSRNIDAARRIVEDFLKTNDRIYPRLVE